MGLVGIPYPPPLGIQVVNLIYAGGTIISSAPTWTAIGLPGGLTISAGGTLSGVPIASSQGTYHPQFTVTDNLGATATISLPLTIGAMELPPLQITLTTLPPGKQGTNYFQTLAASGGFLPYNWDVVSGSLPAGEYFLSDGRLFGTPTAFGTFTFTARVTDSISFTATQAFSLTIAPAVTIQTEIVQSGAVAIPFQQTLVASGGTPPYTWSLISGSLPLDYRWQPMERSAAPE